MLFFPIAHWCFPGRRWFSRANSCFSWDYCSASLADGSCSRAGWCVSRHLSGVLPDYKCFSPPAFCPAKRRPNVAHMFCSPPRCVQLGPNPQPPTTKNSQNLKRKAAKTTTCNTGTSSFVANMQITPRRRGSTWPARPLGLGGSAQWRPRGRPAA